MNILTYRFTLDTQKNGVQRVLQGFQTGEFTARQMEITLKEGSENYVLPLSNISAVMYVKRPSDETPSINSCAIDYENNKIIYNVADQDIAEAGIVELQLKVINTVLGSTIALVSPKFGMEVWESNVDDSEAEESPVYTALTEALADAMAMKDSAIADLYIDEDNIFTVVFGDGSTYTSTVLADAIARIDDVETNALKAEGYAVGEQNGTPVEAGSVYYHNNSKYYSDQASSSATSAATSEANAALSEAGASGYADTAEAHKNTTAGYMNTTEGYMETTEGYMETAEGYMDDAEDYKDLALGYKNDASTSASNAATSESNASTSASAASTSATNAATSESNASTSATNASNSATLAAGSATSSANSATLSESYAVGGTGTRTGEDNDNAKYYKEQCEQIAAGMAGGLLPMGTVLFANLPTTGMAAGWMYNISDAFTSDNRFKDGGGKSYPAGTNVYVTADLMWDCFAGALVTVNGHTGQSITLDGSDLKATGYSKPASASAIAATDTINQALGKLEKGIESKDIGVASFNSRTGAVSPTDGDYTGNMIPLTGYSIAGSKSAISATDKVNAALGKMEYKLGNIVGSEVTLTGYTKASTSSAIAATDTVNAAMGKLEKRADDNASDISDLQSDVTDLQGDVTAIQTVNSFNVAASDWVTNSDSTTSAAYPKIAEITTALYTATDTPMWEMFGANGIPTETEKESIDMVQYADFSATKITLYANDTPTVALVLKVKGH